VRRGASVARPLDDDDDGDDDVWLAFKGRPTREHQDPRRLA
jgi:hypothetical protein